MEENTWQEPAVAKTEEETDKKCPCCGGVMDFNPATGKLTCPYCGNEETIEVKNKNFVARELDFNQAEADAPCNWGIRTKTVICKSCGAQTVYDVNEMANECPYCGSNQVMEADDSQVMAPGGIIPFRLDAKGASARFRSWISGKFFCPKLAKTSAKPKAFKGLYVPYWTFDTQTKSRYSGEYGIDHRYTDKDGKTRTRTDWYHTSGQYHRFIDDLLICGSTKQREELIRGLEPFDTRQTVEYRPEYMAGFMAERYSLRMKEAWELAKDRICRRLKGEIESKIEEENYADRTRHLSVNTEFSAITYKYLLLPVWISSFQYQDKIYHFMINGQSGKVSGKTPISWIKVGVTVAAALVAGAILWYLID